VTVRGRFYASSVDLFDSAAGVPSAFGAGPRGLAPVPVNAPLAVRMRPRHLDELVGQSHLLAPGSPLRRLVEPGSSSAPSSVILWGPPGTGKTTLAYLIAQSSDRVFVELSAVTAGVKDVRAVIDHAKRLLATGGKETVLFIDEVHRFNKAQQDALLPAVENRWVTLIAATTENPSFSVNSPLLSRSLLLVLQPLTDDDIVEVINHALADQRGLGGALELEPAAATLLVRMAGGDARKSLTILEAAAAAALVSNRPADLSAEGAEPPQVITVGIVEKAIDVAAVRYDRDGDQHYDVISAFIKSIRGSDVDAALHYLARMIAAGEDPRFIARRLIVHAAEDIGMADPSALQTAVAAAQAAQLIGMPEARIPLAEAVIHLATAAKSNATVVAIDAALADVKAGKIGPVPAHLRDGHYPGAKQIGHGKGYIYPHDDPNGIVPQQYLPDIIADAIYYTPTNRGYEQQVTTRLERYRAIQKP